MTNTTLHVVFGMSAAGSLRQALRDAGQDDRIAGYFDNLAMGPINPPDQQTRVLHWMEAELHYPDDYRWGHAEEAAFWAEEEAFWKAALVEDVRKVVWMSRRSAQEYCGFLEWLWRLGDSPCEVVDLTDMPIGRRGGRAHTLAVLSPQEVAANALWDRAEALDASARSHCHGLWRQLRVENAPLRVVGPDGLRSAPITFFDQQLLSHAKASWQKSARIIGETIADWVGSPREPYYQAGTAILDARIIALVQLGVLEGRGDLTNTRQSEVHLPQSSALRGRAGTA